MGQDYSGVTKIIVAGGLNKLRKDINSVEILNPAISNKWEYGPSIPSKPFNLHAGARNPFVGGAMVTSPNGKGVVAILVGAYASDINEIDSNKAHGQKSNTLIELKAGASNWTILNQKLEYARTMPI